MNQKIIVDTGPLVAFINRRDAQHKWVKSQLENIAPPLITCEAVLSEACFLLRNLSEAQEALLECLHRNLISIPFRLSEENSAVRRLMVRYANIPMSLADACLVRLSEQYNNSKVLTLDHDFEIYRKHGRQVVPVLMPE